MSCKSCVCFDSESKLHCAVNPIAAKVYHPDQPNNCNDFQLKSSSSTEQRQLASPSQLTNQLYSEVCQAQSHIRQLSIDLQQLNREQDEIQNIFAEIQALRRVEQERQHFANENKLIASGQRLFIVSLFASMMMLCFNHHLMASYAAFGFGATAFSYGYVLYPRKLD